MGSDSMKRSLLLLGLWLVSAAVSGTDKLYRYHDGEGVLVINHTLPAQYVAHGYEVLDARGRLLEVVAPPQPLPLVEGEEIPATILANLAKLRGQRDSTAHSLRIREEELKVVTRQYAGYLARFALLQSEDGQG